MSVLERLEGPFIDALHEIPVPEVTRVMPRIVEVHLCRVWQSSVASPICLAGLKHLFAPLARLTIAPSLLRIIDKPVYATTVETSEGSPVNPGRFRRSLSFALPWPRALRSLFGIRSCALWAPGYLRDTRRYLPVANGRSSPPLRRRGRDGVTAVATLRGTRMPAPGKGDYE